MKEHKEVSALLQQAKQERRCCYGTSDAQRRALKRRLHAGELVSPYKNLYADRTLWNTMTREQQSLQVIRALSAIHPQWVFAGLSAACVYGLQHNYSLHDGTVHIASKSGIGGGDEARLNRIYINRIPTRKHNGILLTTPARTLLDCAVFPFPQALPIYDSALRKSLTTIEEVQSLMIQSVCDEVSVTKLLKYADPLSENGGESLMRGQITELSFGIPLLQVQFMNPDNPAMSYRVDFCWKLADGRIIVAEYDGMAKYADISNKNRASLQAKMEYDRRRDRHLREQGVTEIVHVFYEDLLRPINLETSCSRPVCPKSGEDRPHFVKTVRLRRLSVRFPRHEAIPRENRTLRTRPSEGRLDNLLTTEWYLKNGDIPPETPRAE